MFNLAHRREGQQLARVLAQLEAAVPQRASRFHDRRRRLQEDVARMRDNWWSWPDAHRTADVGRAVRDLQALSVALGDLFGDVARLQARVRALQERLHEAPELGDRAAARCAVWSAEMARLGNGATRPDEVNADRAALVRMAADVRDVEEATRLLAEARDIVAAHSKELHVAALEVDLPIWRAEFLERGASADLLRRLEGAIAPLRVLAKPAAPAEPRPDPRLFEIRGMLTETARWAATIGDRDVSGLDELHDRLMLLEGDKAENPGAVAQLAADAEALCARYAGRAREAHAVRLRTLVEDYRLYARFCGDDSAIASDVERLRGMTVDQPLNYEDWLYAAARVENRLQAESGARRPLLAVALQDEIKRLGARLAELRSELLSHAVRGDLEQLQAQLETSQIADSREAIVSGLRTCAAADVAIDHLAELGRDERHAEHVRVGVLTERARGLYEAAVHLGCALPDRGPDVVAAARGVPALDERRALLDAVTDQLDKDAEVFIAHCLRRVEEDRRFCLAAGSLLQRLFPDVPVADLEPAPAMPSPVAARAAALDMAARRTGLADRLQKERGRLVPEAERMREELAAVDPEPLRPEDRRHAELLAAALAAATEHGDVESSLEALVTALGEVQAFLELLHRDEKAARRRFAELEQELRQLRADGLDEYFPEWTMRVSGLLEGLPWRTRRWTTIEAQLAAAAALLGVLVAQSRRVAAADVAAAVAQVRDRVGILREAAARREATQVLEAIAGNEALPTRQLRQRLLALVPRRHELDGD